MRKSEPTGDQSACSKLVSKTTLDATQRVHSTTVDELPDNNNDHEAPDNYCEVSSAVTELNGGASDNRLVIHVVQPEDHDDGSYPDQQDNHSLGHGSQRRHRPHTNIHLSSGSNRKIVRHNSNLSMKRNIFGGAKRTLTKPKTKATVAALAATGSDDMMIPIECQNQCQPVKDSDSLATTTSDVNSDDDAASIVSRLSMIVTEQEELDQRRSPSASSRMELRSSASDSKLDKISAAAVLHTDNCITEPLESEPVCSDGSREGQGLPASQSSTSMTNASDQLKLSRLRSQTVNIVDHEQQESNKKTIVTNTNTNVATKSNNTLHADSMDNMLTITRSTWTLSEFDRIFPRTSNKTSNKERKRSTDFGSNSGTLADNPFAAVSVNYQPLAGSGGRDGGGQSKDDSLAEHHNHNSVDMANGKKQVVFETKRRSHTNASQDTTATSADNDKRKTKRTVHEFVTRYFPPADWLIHYQIRECLWGDLMAGLVVATLNISLCLSASLLADVDTGVGFRSSIVNTLFYSLFATSRHTSFGAYSIMALMASVTVQKAMDDEMVMFRLELGPSASMNQQDYEMCRYKIIIFYTFLVGLVQLLAGLLGLGTIVASFIPEALSSSMIASTAVTMAIGQLANMCGLNYKNMFEQQTGDPSQLLGNTFKWAHQLLLLGSNLQSINYACFGLSLGSMALLFANQLIFQRRLEKMFKRRIMIPFELLLLILSTLVSYLLHLEQDYKVQTSGPVEITFDIPTMPDFRLIQELWLDGLTAGLISFTMTCTLAKLLANKLNYELDSNLELIACGIGNLMGGLFDALPASGSSIRSSTQVAVGGKTQLASLVNCILLILLAQTCGQLIAPLPRCVMATILCYGFIRMMTQMRDAFKYWRLCKMDFSIWIVGFVAILSVDLVYGFALAFIYSILTILYRAQNRRAYLLGSIDSSDVYVPINKYPAAKKLEGIEIFQYCGSLHYASSELFEQKLRQQTCVNVKQIKRLIESINSKVEQQQRKSNLMIPDKHNNHKEFNIPTHIILDFAMISFVDSSGVFTIRKIIEEYQSVNIIVLFASLATHVAATVKSEPLLWDVYHSRFYVTLSDAVHNALRQRNLALV